MSVPEVLLVGHSHTNAIMEAYWAMEREGSVPVRLHDFRLFDPAYEPAIERGEVNPKLARELAQTVRERPIRAAFLSLFGNAHLMLGLVNHPRPFDFVLRKRRQLPLADAEIVPEAFVRAALAPAIAVFEEWLTALRPLIAVPIYHLEPAPPIPSNEHVAMTQEPFVLESLNLKKRGVAPPLLRWKLWRLHSELTAAVCRRHDLTFLTAPAETMDAAGFLAEPGWPIGNATHGNAWYGRFVLAQMKEQALGAGAPSSREVQA